LSDYLSQIAKYTEQEAEKETQLLRFIKNLTNFEDIVPQQYRPNLLAKAWEDGHSNGWYSVYQKLDELVDLFKV
jgi:hypothetical protein